MRYLVLPLLALALLLPAAASADVASQVIFEADNGAVTVTITFDNVTGALSNVSGVVPSGTMTVILSRTGQPDITIVKTANWSQNIPAGYVLTKDRGGGWGWRGSPSYSIGWHP